MLRHGCRTTALPERHVVQIHLEDGVLDARVVMISATHASSSLRLTRLLARVLSVIPETSWQKDVRATCCVIVLGAGGVGASAADVRSGSRR